MIVNTRLAMVCLSPEERTEEVQICCEQPSFS